MDYPLLVKLSNIPADTGTAGLWINYPMTLAAFVLVLTSAITHAGWNLLSRHERPSMAFFLRANLAGTLFLVPFLILRFQQLVQFPHQVWLLLAASGLFQAIYFISLAKGYRNGEMSIVYPLARTAPVPVIAVISTLIGQSSLTDSFFFGAVLIICGSFLLPLDHFGAVQYDRSVFPLLLYAAGAALGTTGYSLSDSHALNLLNEATVINSAGASLQITLLYWGCECASSCTWLFLFYLITKKQPEVKTHLPTRKIRQSLLIGIQISLTYFLVLMAMNNVSNVSYVVALRQASIPIGVLLGILILKESASKPKITGTVLITLGLVLVSVIP